MVILIDCNINEGCSKVILLGSNGKVIVSGMGIIALPMEGDKRVKGIGRVFGRELVGKT